jgi:hypothetical protein
MTTSDQDPARTQYSAPQVAERKRHRVHLARLEADVAYFEARLQLIGKPCTIHQRAHRRTFEVLHHALASEARKLRADNPDLAL